MIPAKGEAAEMTGQACPVIGHGANSVMTPVQPHLHGGAIGRSCIIFLPKVTRTHRWRLISTVRFVLRDFEVFERGMEE